MDLQVAHITALEKGKSRVCLEDGTEFILYKGEIRKLGIEENSFVTEEMQDVIFHAILGKRAKKRALHLLERQDRTEKQLREKLRQGGYPEHCIEDAIEYVKGYHYLDDYRYACIYIRYRQEKKSRQRLCMDLAAKGVERDLIETALEEEYFSDDIEKIMELLRKRHYTFEAAEENEKRKQYQFLLRRGFQSRDILKAMQSKDR